ncbi:hypothetical protein KC315_g18485, partial [Hortaea werneckii]
MLQKTNDVKGDIEDAIVKTTKKDKVEEETTDDTGLNQKTSTTPATLDDIETTMMAGASTDTGRDPGTTHDENVATAQDHPDTNDAGGQKAAAPARHRPGKPAVPYHPKTNPTAATPASKADAPTPPAVLHPRPNRNPTTNP